MITVVGSLNIDFIFSVKQRPRIGETILTDSYEIQFGGKGGNQAVASRKLGSEVALIAAVGDDPFGKEYLSFLNEQGINTDYVSLADKTPTGTAMVTLENNDNSIIYAKGANNMLNPSHIKEAENLIINSDLIVIQFEINSDVIQEVLETANKHNIPVILNPAPFVSFPKEWLEMVTFVTPNETEFEAIKKSGLYDEKYLNKFIITKGKNGVSYIEDGKEFRVKAPKVNVKDTTGAGDTFNAALAHFISRGEELNNACRKSVYAASYSTTQLGAQKGMPTIEELESFISEMKKSDCS